MCYNTSMKADDGKDSEDKISELLTRGVDKIYPSKEKLEEHIERSGINIDAYNN